MKCLFFFPCSSFLSDFFYRYLINFLLFIPDERTEIQYCPNPGLVLNGNAQYIPPPLKHKRDPIFDEYPEQSILEFSCYEGYRLQGHSSVTCRSTGFWSGKIPSCVSGKSGGSEIFRIFFDCISSVNGFYSKIGIKNPSSSLS